MDTITITNLVIYGLAIWRISNLFISERGPFSIFMWIRERFGFSHDDQGNVFIIPAGFWGETFSCVWCFSIWAGLFFSFFWLYFPYWSLVTAIPFSFSAVAIISSLAIERLKR